MINKEFDEKIKRHKDCYLERVNEDKWRSKYHIMAPIGWINDPNGLCEFNGEYHVYYQYSPLDANGGLKFWGHYTSNDFVNWKDEGIALYPDEKVDKDGVYSGSALVKGDEVFFFYTGNVKKEGNYDYVLTGREQNVIVVKSCDGINFSEKKVVLSNDDFPDNMSLHVRDPKVWEEDGIYYMILGARGKNNLGYTLLYKSLDLYNWNLIKEPIGGISGMGYMWECPDLFKLEVEEGFLFSPQGIEPKGLMYNNIYQSGYVKADIRDGEKIKLSKFTEIDRGFDFYAPQTFLDNSGRRIMFGWMGIPDEIKHINPTVKNYWQHQLTIPRELTLKNNKIYQNPIKEIEALRLEPVVKQIIIDEEVELELFEQNTYELYIDTRLTEEFKIKFREDCRLISKDKIFSLILGESGYGREKRSVGISKVNNLRIFSDNSSLEIFINDGEEVFSTRIYNKGIDKIFYINGIGEVYLKNGITKK